MRIGMGYDVHKLVPNRDLILGGVKFPMNWGFWDIQMRMFCSTVLWMHCLGAAALGDIGKHFPDTDPDL